MKSAGFPSAMLKKGRTYALCNSADVKTILCTFLHGMSRGHKGQRYMASGWIASGRSRLRLLVDTEILLAH